MLPLKKIICPTDFGEYSDEALRRASEWAIHFGAELCLLYVVTPQPAELGVAAYCDPDYDQQKWNMSRRNLDILLEERIPKTVKARALLGYGATVDEIERAATAERADLVVMATHGLTGWRHLLFGSITEMTVRLASCPVLALHHCQNSSEEKPMLPLRKLICPIDFSAPSYAALAQASELAAHFGAELGLLHIVPTISEEVSPGVYAAPAYNGPRLTAARERLCKIIEERVPQDVNAYPIVRLGKAEEEIVHTMQQEDADLLVMATYGLTGWRHLFFGSVAESVLRLIQSPILIVHAPPGS